MPPAHTPAVESPATRSLSARGASPAWVVVLDAPGRWVVGVLRPDTVPGAVVPTVDDGAPGALVGTGGRAVTTGTGEVTRVVSSSNAISSVESSWPTRGRAVASTSTMPSADTAPTGACHRRAVSAPPKRTGR